MDRVDSWTTYETLTIFQEPLCLIENGPGGKLKACSTVLDQLKLIRCPLNVIAIMGPYRTGKSYLLNYLAGKRQGFPLGSSIQAVTKGIWVWCRPHPERYNEVLLLLDTEGLGDVMKFDEKNDIRIFALSVLLSNTLVYNCKSTISQNGISQLYFVTELTKQIKTRATSENKDRREFFKLFPNFVWVVRDFTLELEDEGKQITADDYLAKLLKTKEGTAGNDNYNKPRQGICEFFEDRKCFVFPMPVEGDTNQELAGLDDSHLKPKFRFEVKKFSHYINTRYSPKTAKGQPIIGKMFCHLLETYLAIIRKIPMCVEGR